MTKEKKLDPHIERMRVARVKVQERIEDRRRQHQTRKVHGSHWAHGSRCYETMDRRAEDEHR